MDEDDPKGLIREAYRMDGIGASECRSIFLDWALTVPGDPRPSIERLLERHGQGAHPMDTVLEDGLRDVPAPRRRGGRRGRLEG